LPRRSVLRGSMGLAAASAKWPTTWLHKQRTDKAFRRLEDIFAQYPIHQA
jgi:hypothetical protein